jgi:hypothetical protein
MEVQPYPPPAKANGSIRSAAIIEIVTIKLLALVTLHHLLGHNVLV